MSQKPFLIFVALMLTLPIAYGGLRAYITPMEFRDIYAEGIIESEMGNEPEEETATTENSSNTFVQSTRGTSGSPPTNIPHYIPSMFGRTFPDVELVTQPAPVTDPAPTVAVVQNSQQPTVNTATTANTFIPTTTSNIAAPPPPQRVTEPVQQEIIFPQNATVYNAPPSTTKQREVLAAYEEVTGTPTAYDYPQQQYRAPTPSHSPGPYVAQNSYFPSAPAVQNVNVQQPEQVLNNQVVAWQQQYQAAATNQVLQLPSQYGYFYPTTVTKNNLTDSGPEMIAVAISCLGGSFGLRYSRRKKS